MLLGRLDSLRRHLHAETAAEADHGMDDGGGIGGLLDRAHETGIDLELVERKTPQIKQTGIPSAEIVERKAHADAFELQHRQFGVFQIAEECALGQFKFETVGLETGLGENALDQLDKIWPAELQRRDVDGDGQCRPIASIETGAAQHEFAKLDDQPVPVLRVNGDFMGCVVPAGQHEVEDEVQLDLPVVQRRCVLLLEAADRLADLLGRPEGRPRQQALGVVVVVLVCLDAEERRTEQNRQADVADEGRAITGFGRVDREGACVRPRIVLADAT